MSTQPTPHWTQQFASMINTISNPTSALVFPDDYEIECNECGDALEQVESSELCFAPNAPTQFVVTVGKGSPHMWLQKRTSFGCRNCGFFSEEG